MPSKHWNRKLEQLITEPDRSSVRRALSTAAVAAALILFGRTAQAADAKHAPAKSGSTAPANDPRGKFMERLQRAKERAQHANERASADRAARRAAVERAARARAVRAVRRAPAPRRAPVIAAAPPILKPAAVTYSFAPRPPGGTAPRGTGDIVLTADPPGTRVYYYPNGGAQLRDLTNATIVGWRKPKAAILAFAPAINRRVVAYVPVRPDRVTTAHFHFSRPPAAKGGTN